MATEIAKAILERGKHTPKKIRFEMDPSASVSLSCYITKGFDKELGEPKQLLVTVHVILTKEGENV